MEKGKNGFPQMNKPEIKSWILIITYAFALLWVVLNIKAVGNGISNVLKMLTPFIIGFIIAYLLNRPLAFIKNKVLKSMENSKNPKIRKAQKPVAILLTYILILGIAGIFIGLVVPQLITSATIMVNTISESSSRWEELFNNLISDNEFTGFIWEQVETFWKEISTALSNIFKTLVPSLVTAVSNFTSGLTHTFIGIIVSVYLLADKEHMLRLCRKIVYALTPKKFADKSVEVARLTDETFGSFIVGQITVAAILGLLCFISMVILRMPYAMLISVIVGFSNIIPYFGPFLGAVPGTFILLTVNPMQGLIFVVLVIILQQIDNNFISPKIVGGNLGLSGLWVLFAITVGGGLFGIGGMVIGAPAFAVIYHLSREYINNKLKAKGRNV